MDPSEVYLRRWEYKERHIKGRYAREVYDIYIPLTGSKYYVLRDIVVEELAVYLCRLHNDLVDSYCDLVADIQSKLVGVNPKDAERKG